MSEQKRTLNLDELFGNHKDLVVVWDGQRHFLRHPMGMGPSDLLKLEQLQATHANLTPENGDQLEAVVDDIIRMIAPTLAALNLPFFAKMRILTFYQSELEAEHAASPKAKAGGARKTGATSTAA